VPRVRRIDTVIPVEILGHRGQVIKAVRQGEVTARIRVAQLDRLPSYVRASKCCLWLRARGFVFQIRERGDFMPGMATLALRQTTIFLLGTDAVSGSDRESAGGV